MPLKDGALVPVRALADVDLGSSRAVITRENGKRYVGIRMNVRNRDLGSFIAEAQERVGKHVKLPVGYDLLWGGEFENQQRAMKRLTLVLPLSILLTFLLLFSAFGTVWDATIILLNMPVALLGGLVALGMAGMTLSVSAAVGFIALLGQAVLNGVLVVSAIRARIDRGQDLWTATIEGARERLRAVLMTALLASLGLLPAAMSHAIGTETQRPIAVVVVGGTISAALLTLIVLPVSYYWAGWPARSSGSTSGGPATARRSPRRRPSIRPLPGSEPHGPAGLLAAEHVAGDHHRAGSATCPRRSGAAWRRASASRPGTPSCSRSRRRSAPRRSRSASPRRRRRPSRSSTRCSTGRPCRPSTPPCA